MLSCQAAFAGGRLIATGGVTEIEGSAGGGIVPWAIIAGMETRDEVGGTAFYTHIALPNYDVDSAGVAVGINERLELSYARETLSINNAITAPIQAALSLPLGILDGSTISQDIIGAKLKIAGDAVYDQDSMMPQIAIGAQHKVNTDFKQVLGITGIPEVLGAKNAAGTDFYLAMTKLFLGGAGGLNLLLNGTIRETSANSDGLLGFGCAPGACRIGSGGGGYSTQGEGSAAVLLNPNTAIGAEYRTMPNNLKSTDEDAWKDLFLAYFPNKQLAFTLAYAALGNFPSGISAAGITRQQTNGLLLSGQVSFP
jgi:hypothetical protein